ncbi:MAG TPA: phosphoribosylanthranilate isomerase [Acidimicrobiales bacterium]|nr:phosphoribosylanthranilate isomerase [Acidimicrobiales bacterium]
MAETLERGFIKICGVTNVADARAVIGAGASALGLIFAESPRRVSIDQAHDILEATEGELLRSAVFRENDDESIRAHLRGLDVEMVQIHGTLSEGLLDTIRERPRVLVKALSIESREFLTFDELRVDAVLIDGPRPGSGATHSWERMAQREFRVPVIASGGLNPNNVAETIMATMATGVDCDSGVEAVLGLKDHQRVSSFVANARQAFSLLKE